MSLAAASKSVPQVKVTLTYEGANESKLSFSKTALLRLME